MTNVDDAPVEPGDLEDPVAGGSDPAAEVTSEPGVPVEPVEPVAEAASSEAASSEAAPQSAAAPIRPLQVGEKVLLIDNKKRRYLITLAEGGEFHSHAGYLAHEDLIGQDEGRSVRSTRGGRFIAFRPTLSDFVLKMPRGAQVIYPKDLGPILMMADIFPGAKILESGVGSGALSMTMLRAGASIVGYELREDFANRAQTNVRGFLGEEALERYDVQQRDCYDGIDEQGLDRIVLDLPEPWNVTPHAQGALRPGGLIVAYTPTITQAVSFRQSMEAGPWGMAETMEVLNRGWYIEGMSVRPDHRMVAHTGFLTVGRLLSM